MQRRLNTEESRRSAALIRDLGELRGAACHACGAKVGPHHALMAIVMGFKNTPRCAPCLAAGLKEDPSELRASLITYISQRRCYTEAWNWASRQAGLPELTASTNMNEESASAEKDFAVADAWDAGDQGCGELALELRMRLEKLKAGEVFRLTARDPGVPEDMPAWCRLTGHKLLRAAHPSYWIQRKA